MKQPAPRRVYKTVNPTHTKQDKDGGVFEIKDDCPVLVIGDSQVKNLILNPRFQVESFSGGRYPWITEVVPNLDLPDSLDHIVLAVGINDRDANFSQVTGPTLRTCLDSLRTTRRKIHFLGIDLPQNFTREQEDQVKRINRLAAELVGEDFYIKPDEYFATVEDDGLHYDEDTLKDISNRMKHHFDFLNSFV